MGNEWRKFRLDEVTDLIIDCPHSTPKWTDSGVLVLRSQYIKGGRLNLSNPSFTTEEGYQARIKRAVPSAGDIVLTREAPMGEVCMIPENLKCCLGQRMVLLRAKSDILDSTYLLYTLQSPFLQHQISWNEGTGTTVSNIRIPSIKAFEIPTPDLSVQKKIAHILGSIDSKIQLNRETNQTLEAMAQALFKSWFVDFDPVFDNIIAHNLAHNNAPLHNIPEPLLPHAQRRLNAHNVGRGSARQTAAHAFHHLFPQAFEQSDEPSVGIQGWVPKGWGAVAMESLVDIASSKRVFAKDYKEKGVPFFRGKEISELSKGNKINTEIFISEEKFEELKNLSGIPKEGDILITSVGTIGNTYQVTRDDRFYFKDGNLTWIKAYKKVFMPHFIMEWFRNSAGIEAIERIKIGTTQQAITIKGLNKILIVNAPKNILLEFEAICSSLYRKIGKNIKETSSLESLRDTLLPKLISGELRIPDAEQATEALAK